MLNRIVRRRLVPQAWRLNGRLATHFQSSAFSNDGRTLIYLPGPSPRSNGDATWDIYLHSLDSGNNITLSGHRDAIMWIGFSPDDALVGSACWDGTFRMWDAATGEQRWKWTTEYQNWAAIFSPDGNRFLGTDGKGVIRVWNVENGALDVVLDHGTSRGWHRHVSWSNDGRWVAIGGEKLGNILLFDMHAVAEEIDGQKSLRAVQERKLSTAMTQVDEEKIEHNGHFLSMRSVKFLPHGLGLTLVATTHNDPGVDVYHLQTGLKTRIALSEENEQGHEVEWAYLDASSEIAVISSEAIRFWKV